MKFKTIYADPPFLDKGRKIHPQIKLRPWLADRYIAGITMIEPFSFHLNMRLYDALALDSAGDCIALYPDEDGKVYIVKSDYGLRVVPYGTYMRSQPPPNIPENRDLRQRIMNMFEMLNGIVSQSNLSGFILADVSARKKMNGRWFVPICPQLIW